MGTLQMKSLMKEGILVEFGDGVIAIIAQGHLIFNNNHSEKLETFWRYEKASYGHPIVALYRIVRHPEMQLEKIWELVTIPEITEQERVILRAIDDRLVYIARDSISGPNNLYLYYSKPEDKNGEFVCDSDKTGYESLSAFSGLFPTITHKNSPIKITDLLAADVERRKRK